jgi:predicted molibdopterin-dependent oxidoreductase YjgC
MTRLQNIPKYSKSILTYNPSKANKYISILKDDLARAAEMAQQLKTLTILLKDPSSAPSNPNG